MDENLSTKDIPDGATCFDGGFVKDGKAYFWNPPDSEDNDEFLKRIGASIVERGGISGFVVIVATADGKFHTESAFANLWTKQAVMPKFIHAMTAYLHGKDAKNYDLIPTSVQ